MGLYPISPVQTRAYQHSITKVSFHYGADHYGAGPVWRIPVWLSSVLAHAGVVLRNIVLNVPCRVRRVVYAIKQNIPTTQLKNKLTGRGDSNLDASPFRRLCLSITHLVGLYPISPVQTRAYQHSITKVSFHYGPDHYGAGPVWRIPVWLSSVLAHAGVWRCSGVTQFRRHVMWRNSTLFLYGHICTY